MKDSSQADNWYREVADTWTSEQRKSWYSAVASAYNRTRPRYPKTMISRAVSLAQLPEEASILEIGCGPGNATEAFGELGFQMVCLEPSESACQLARQNSAQYANVEIKNTSFYSFPLATPGNAQPRLCLQVPGAIAAGFNTCRFCTQGQVKQRYFEHSPEC